MSATPAGRQRLKAFRLTDVPETIRARAYDKLIQTEGTRDGVLVASRSLPEQVALGAAYVSPSDRLYWIPLEAWRRVMEPRRRR